MGKGSTVKQATRQGSRSEAQGGHIRETVGHPIDWSFRVLEVRTSFHARFWGSSLPSTQEALAQRRASSRPTSNSARIVPHLASSVEEVAQLAACSAAVEGWSPGLGCGLIEPRGRSVCQRDSMPLLATSLFQGLPRGPLAAGKLIPR